MLSRGLMVKHSQKSKGSQIRQTWVQLLAPPLVCCNTWGVHLIFLGLYFLKRDKMGIILDKNVVLINILIDMHRDTSYPDGDGDNHSDDDESAH